MRNNQSKIFCLADAECDLFKYRLCWNSHQKAKNLYSNDSQIAQQAISKSLHSPQLVHFNADLDTISVRAKKQLEEATQIRQLSQKQQWKEEMHSLQKIQMIQFQREAAEIEAIIKPFQRQLQSIATKIQAVRNAVKTKIRQINDAQELRKSEITREKGLNLVIDGKAVPIIRMASTKIKSPVTLWYFENSQHFVYYDGCPNDDCAICLDHCRKGMKMTHLFCKHVFHTQCIEDWLNRKDYCPLCKQDFRKHEEYDYIRQMLSNEQSYKEWITTQSQLQMRNILEEKKQQSLKLKSKLIDRKEKQPGNVKIFVNQITIRLLKSWKHFVCLQQSPDQNCAICQSHKQNDQILTILGCNHVFHLICIADWAKAKNCCPICEKSFVQNDQ